MFLLLELAFTPTHALSINIPQNDRDNFSQEFLGKWKMQSVVTSSRCPYVIVGSTTESELEITPEINSNRNILLNAIWHGGNWTDCTGNIKFLNKKEAITERVTELKSDDENIWKAILIDHLKLDEDKNKMQSESIVIQYKNGQAVGEYKTYSILTKY